MPVHIGKPVIAPLEAEGEARVVEAELLENIQEETQPLYDRRRAQTRRIGAAILQR